MSNTHWKLLVLATFVTLAISDSEVDSWKIQEMNKIVATPIDAEIPDPFLSGTVDPTPDEIAEIDAVVQKYKESGWIAPTSTIQVPVVFHIMEETDCPTKNRINGKIRDQIDALNNAFSKNRAGFEFILVATKYLVNSKWWNENWFKQKDSFRAATRIGGKNTLNIWFTKGYETDDNKEVMGMAKYPWEAKSSRDGVIVNHLAIKGGAYANYNEGDILVHEVGHWLGLLHTFQGGCNSINDIIDDTPAEKSAANGCPMGRNTCKSSGEDPIHNYMDYTYDSCRYEFTSSQKSRMQLMWYVYRTELNTPTPRPGRIPPTPVCSNPTPSPTLQPSEPSSCISGEAGLRQTNFGRKDLITKIKDIQIGNTVSGFDSKLRPSICKIEAIGSFGFGKVYGNYTSDHFILNNDTGVVEEYGKNGPVTVVEKFDLISDCPLVEDEVGIRFASIDSDFCGGGINKISWKDYVRLHSAILKVIRGSGPFWFQGASYNDMSMVRKYAPRVCRTMLKCVKNKQKCKWFEKASIKFIDRALTDVAKAKALKSFVGIGSPCRTRSVSAVITSGRSVDESLVGTSDC